VFEGPGRLIVIIYDAPKILPFINADPKMRVSCPGCKKPFMLRDGKTIQGACNGETGAGRTARVRLAWEGLLVPIEGFGLRDALQGGSGGAKDVYSEFGDLLVH
jgi:hypothetical protein